MFRSKFSTRWRYGLTGVIALAGLLMIGSPALASHSGKTVMLPQNQTVTHDYFVAGSIVEVDGTVDGDIYVAGGQVIINGTVNGDVLAAGGTVTIDGTINGNVRVVGGNITIDGHVAKNVSVAGGSVELAHSATIDSSVAVVSGNLQDSGSIRGDVNSATGQLTIGSDAHVGGSVVYWSKQSATIGSGTVAGSVTHRIPPARHAHRRGFAGALLVALYWFAVTYIFAVLLSLWLPRQSQAVTRMVRERPWRSLGWGIVGIIAVPILGIVLMITVVGIPLALILWAIYAIMILLAPVWVIMALRELFMAKIATKLNAFVALLVVAFAYMLITLIPVVGPLLVIISGLIGFGASLTAGRMTYQHLRRGSKPEL